MLTSSGSGAVSGVRPATPYFPAAERENTVQTAQNTHQYDSVSLSSPAKGENRFHKELVSRLSREVRTATTTGDIQNLRRQVTGGAYQPNPMAIAARILFLTEEP